MHRPLLAAAIALIAVAAGCDPAATQMDVPTDFVPLERPEGDRYDAAAISADGVIVTCRTELNPKSGTLAFWTEAVKKELRDRGDYTLGSSDDVETSDGLKGKLLSFSTKRRGAALTYLVAVFVDGEQIRVAEATGRTEDVKKHMAAIRPALRSVRGQ